MKKLISIFLAFAVCLGLCACGQDTSGTSATQNQSGSTHSTTPTQTDPKPLADFDILGEWIIADDGLAVITFNEDGTCFVAGEQAVKYKVEADIAVLIIYYAMPQSYNIEKAGEHYRITGEHFLLREDDATQIIKIKEAQEKYDRAFELLSPYLTHTGNPWQVYADLGYDAIATAYTLLKSICDYRDVAGYLSHFVVSENVLLSENGKCFGYSAVGEKIWAGSKRNQGDYYFYDEQGHLIREETFPLEDDGYNANVDYRYDDKGNLGEKIYTFANGETEAFKYTYDDFGSIVREEYYQKGSSEPRVSCYEHKYNEKGQLEETKQTEGSPYYNIWKYRYDDSGNLIEEEVYTLRDNGHVLYQKYIYDYEDGKQVKDVQIIYQNDGLTEKSRREYFYEYQYDENGNLLKKTTYKIDENGHLQIFSTEEYSYGTFCWYNAPEA